MEKFRKSMAIHEGAIHHEAQSSYIELLSLDIEERQLLFLFSSK